MNPTTADLVTIIGEQTVEIRLLRRSLAELQKKITEAQAQIKITTAALAARDQAAAESEPEPESP